MQTLVTMIALGRGHVHRDSFWLATSPWGRMSRMSTKIAQDSARCINTSPKTPHEALRPPQNGSPMVPPGRRNVSNRREDECVGVLAVSLPMLIRSLKAPR
eukprot:1097200-Pyramimonas_sp.AAC.1